MLGNPTVADRTKLAGAYGTLTEDDGHQRDSASDNDQCGSYPDHV